MIKSQHVIKSGFLLLCARTISILGGSVVMIFLARWLEPENYGLIVLVTTLVGIIGLFADLGLSPSIARFVSDYSEKPAALRAIISQGLMLKTTVLVISGVALWKLIPYFSIWLKDSRLQDVICFIFFLVFFMEIVRVLNKIFEGLSCLYYFAYTKIIQGIAYPLLALLLVWKGWGIRGALLGQVMGFAIQTILAIFFLAVLLYYKGVLQNPPHTPLPHRPDNQNRWWVGQIMRYSIPLILVSAGFYVYRRSDILMIQYFLGSSQVAFYHVQFRIINLVHIPATVLGAVIAPYFSKQRVETYDRSQLFHRCMRYIFLFYLPLAGVVFILAQPIINVIFGSKYLPGINVLRINVLLYMPLLSISAVVSLILNYQGRAAFRAYVIGVSAAANIILNLFLIPRYGIIGAAIATQISYTPTIILYIREVLIELGTDWREVLRYTKKIVLLTFLMIIVLIPIRGLIHTPVWQLVSVPFIGAVIFGIAAWRMKILTRDDLKYARGLMRLKD